MMTVTAASCGVMRTMLMMGQLLMVMRMNQFTKILLDDYGTEGAYHDEHSEDDDA